MNSDDIRQTLHSCNATRDSFIGVYPANRLPHTVRTRPALLVANLQEDFLPGSHWVAFYLPEFVNGVEYFDCLGEAPHNSYFNRFIARHGGLIPFNNRPLQSIFSDVCGEFCCIYNYYRSVGLSFRNIVNMFGKNRSSNDLRVIQLFNTQFTCNIHFGRASLRAFHAQSCSPRCHTSGNACVARSPRTERCCNAPRRRRPPSTSPARPAASHKKAIPRR